MTKRKRSSEAATETATPPEPGLDPTDEGLHPDTARQVAALGTTQESAAVARRQRQAVAAYGGAVSSQYHVGHAFGYEGVLYTRENQQDVALLPTEVIEGQLASGNIVLNPAF